MRNNGKLVVFTLENDTFSVITTWKLVGENSSLFKIL